MSFLQSELRQLSLPRFPMNRADAVRMLLTHEYGVIPPVSCKAEARILSEDREFCAGKATLRTVELTLALPGCSFSFPMYHTVPKGREQYPLFVLANFTADVPDRYFPVEEICDRGYGVLSVGYNDISKDTDDGFSEGLGKLLRQEAANAGVPPEQLPGKIAIWAWAAMRVMDYAEKELADKLDMSRSIVCGHSRLGKTALLAGAYDTRFQFVYSNDSGCTGAAISRYKTGEDLHRVINANPFWYCPGFNVKYDYGEYKLPFDQHYLLACVAPRKLLVGSAIKDKTADPLSEQLACLAASPAFPNGFACSVVAKAGEEYFEGDIGYHVREGTHYFHREDWQKLMKFVEYHTSK